MLLAIFVTKSSMLRKVYSFVMTRTTVATTTAVRGALKVTWWARERKYAVKGSL
jgi:hypothetical protein